MIVGETVYVLRKKRIGIDEFNAAVWDEVPERVDNVLVSPGTQNSVSEDVIESERPDGKQVKYTLHFPKTYMDDLEFLRIKVRGHICAVVGRPDRYTTENCPTQWNMPVNVEVVDG